MQTIESVTRGIVAGSDLKIVNAWVILNATLVCVVKSSVVKMLDAAIKGLVLSDQTLNLYYMSGEPTPKTSSTPSSPRLEANSQSGMAWKSWRISIALLQPPRMSEKKTFACTDTGSANMLFSVVYHFCCIEAMIN